MNVMTANTEETSAWPTKIHKVGGRSIKINIHTISITYINASDERRKGWEGMWVQQPPLVNDEDSARQLFGSLYTSKAILMF